eukprot:4615709-Prymnesium_polylepis.1
MRDNAAGATVTHQVGHGPCGGNAGARTRCRQPGPTRRPAADPKKLPLSLVEVQCQHVSVRLLKERCMLITSIRPKQCQVAGVRAHTETPRNTCVNCYSSSSSYGCTSRVRRSRTRFRESARASDRGTDVERTHVKRTAGWL